METDDRCGCGAPLGETHACPVLPTCAGDDMLDDVLDGEAGAEWIEALGPEPTEVCS